MSLHTHTGANNAPSINGENALTAIFGEPVHVYTQVDMFEDGFLVDVTETAKEAGILFQTVITREAYETYVAWTEEDTNNQVPQDTEGRLWDVLYMYRIAVKSNRTAKGPVTQFQFHCVLRDGKSTSPKPVWLKAVCGPNDHGDPCITIMMPNES